MGIDVQYLINEWKNIYEMMAPSPKLFPRLSEIDREIAELSLLSSRREYWEVFICLIGYSQQMKENPNKILVDMPFKKIWVGEIEKPWESVPFLRYCTGFKMVQREAFLPATYIVMLTLARGILISTPESIERFQECLRLHNHNLEEFWRCYKGDEQKGEGQKGEGQKGE